MCREASAAVQFCVEVECPARQVTQEEEEEEEEDLLTVNKE